VIGHNEGTFIYNNDFIDKCEINGGWNMVKSGINDSYLQATYGGIVLYKASDLNNYIINDFKSP
jgi:hypothetical protein